VSSAGHGSPVKNFHDRLKIMTLLFQGNYSVVLSLSTDYSSEVKIITQPSTAENNGNGIPHKIIVITSIKGESQMVKRKIRIARVV